ncbi:MAG: enoyl-CoA hydratase [Acidimicrobiia bacterium]|nr:enoyl-CoA hydratase [Acidimicrobiia bacterium]
MSLVRSEQRDAVRVIVLDDPDRRNALSPEMVTDLVAAVEDAEADRRTHGVVVTGAGTAFCAGASLAHLGDAREQGLRLIYEGFLRVADCSLPVVAAVNGPAVGAGLNLALAADVRLAGRSARFDTRFLRLGIHPGGGHTWWLQRAVGPQTARAMLLFGQVLDGADAERVGLAWRCVADDALVDEAVRFAAGAGEAPRDLLVAARRTMAVTAALDDHGAALEVELVAQVHSMDAPAFAERLSDSKR